MVVCRNKKLDKAIFDLHQNGSNTVSIRDARETYDLYSKAPLNSKYDYYLAHGVDGKNVEKYIDIVEKLEKALYPQKEISILGYKLYI
jgi:hypothetical protein